MVGCIAVELHKFPQEIWNMPYADAMLIWREFEDAPPVRMTFAVFVGYKNPNQEFKKKPIGNDEFMALQILSRGQKITNMPPAFRESILWAEEQKKKMRIN
jgi:hypothetical protein